MRVVYPYNGQRLQGERLEEITLQILGAQVPLEAVRNRLFVTVESGSGRVAAVEARVGACRSRMLTYAHVCSRMLAYARVCSRMRTYARVCSRMLSFADGGLGARSRSLNAQHVHELNASHVHEFDAFCGACRQVVYTYVDVC